MLEISTLARFRGALLGFALGDAMGIAVEDRAPDRATRIFKEGIRPLPRGSLLAGQFTSCTMLMVEVAESILDQGVLDGEDLARRIVAWYGRGDLRGIDSGTSESVRRLRRGIPWDQAGDAGYEAVGNSAVMRVLPLALLNFGNPEQLRRDVFTACLPTHRHPEAAAGALAFSVAIGQALSGKIDGLFTTCARAVRNSETGKKLKQAEDLFRRNKPTPRGALLVIGNSSYVPETVAAALYAFFYFPGRYREALSGTLTSGGAASAIAALTGALTGAFAGLEALPEEWLAMLEERERLDTLAVRLHERWRKQSGRGEAG